MVNLIDVNIQAPREINDFRVAILSIVRHLIAGQSLSQIISEDFPLLVEAVKGADKVPQALAEELTKSVALGGLIGGELIGEFLSARQVALKGETMEQNEKLTGLETEKKDQANKATPIEKGTDKDVSKVEKGEKPEAPKKA